MNINGCLSAYTLFMDRLKWIKRNDFSTKSVTFHKCDLSNEVANSGEIINFIILLLSHFNLNFLMNFIVNYY